MKLTALVIALCFGSISGHGICTDPRQRGALRLDNHLVPTVDWDAPTDYQGHYPAGSKSSTPGAGTASLRRAAGNYWTPHEPLNPSNRWRAGVCGDELGAPQDHLKGGKYYHNAYRVREYLQGTVIYMEAEIVTHHNGYFEFYVCNIDTCKDDISVRCFHEGHCRQLMRAPGPCDSGYHEGCGPIDRMNPGRWYLPCRKTEPMIVGGWSRTMEYQLPKDLVCEHCVIHWYWTSANTCNPPGVREYFTSPYAPKWGNCEGQGGARGGWPAGKGVCGGADFPEEYFQCSDIRIVPNPHLGHTHPVREPARPTSHPRPPPSPSPSPGYSGPQTAAELHAQHGFGPSSSGSDDSDDDDHSHNGGSEGSGNGAAVTLSGGTSGETGMNTGSSHGASSGHSHRHAPHGGGPSGGHSHGGRGASGTSMSGGSFAGSSGGSVSS